MPYALPSSPLPSSSSSSTTTATLSPPSRPGHRRTRSAFSDESGPGAFVSMGSLPRRRLSNSTATAKKPLFHLEDEDSPEENAVADGPAPGIISPSYSPTNSLRLSIQSGRFSPSVDPPSYIDIPKRPSSSLTNAVPFPTSSPVTERPVPPFIPPSPPHSASLPRTPSTPIILSNGKPLKSSLKSSSSSPNVAGEFALQQRKHFRAQSAPSTPRVHFAEKDAGLEMVKVFNKGGKPASLSRPSGEETETETEAESYPFPLLSPSSASMLKRWPTSHQLLHEIDTSPSVTSAIPNTSASPLSNVLLETMTLPRTRPPTLRGTVLVRNIAFEKNVAVRFTLDDWQTTSEVTCKHVVSLPVSRTVGDVAASLAQGVETKEEDKPAWDRFSFTIRLEDYETKLADRTIYLVARYISPAGEFWDNNDTKNYRVGFRRSAVSPLSTPRVQPVSTIGNTLFSNGTVGSGAVTSQQRTFSAPSSLKHSTPQQPAAGSPSSRSPHFQSSPPKSPTTQKYISRRLSLSNYEKKDDEDKKSGDEALLTKLKDLPESAKETGENAPEMLSPLIMIGGMPASDVSGPMPRVSSPTTNLPVNNAQADDASPSVLPFGMSPLGAQFGSLSQLASPPVSRQGSENSTPSSSGRNSPNRKPSPPPTFLRRKESPVRLELPDAQSSFADEVRKLSPSAGSPEESESQVDTSDSSYAAFVRQWCFAQSTPPTPGVLNVSPNNSTPPTLLLRPPCLRALRCQESGPCYRRR
ncbi:putative phosphatase regulatory subunit-domain-containing protein [Irpex lacteus]|nr:putative phosphatase regulatory subunit-domain-containing protein [Irpex lacteus]